MGLSRVLSGVPCHYLSLHNCSILIFICQQRYLTWATDSVVKWYTTSKLPSALPYLQSAFVITTSGTCLETFETIKLLFPSNACKRSFWHFPPPPPSHRRVCLACKQFLNSLILWKSKFWQSAHWILPRTSSLYRMLRSLCPPCVGLGLVSIFIYKNLNRVVCCNSNFIKQRVCDNLFFPYIVQIMRLDLSTLTLLWRLPLCNFLGKLEVTFHVSNETFIEFCEYRERKMVRPMCRNISYSRLTTMTDTPKLLSLLITKKGNLLSTFCIVSKMLLQLQ